MTGRFVVATAIKDVRRQLADPVGLLTWMGLPLAIGGLIVLIYAGGASPRGRLLVADEDESFLSGLVGGAAVQGPVAELFDVTPVDVEEGRRIMDAGDASALVVLPAGLQEAVLGEGTAEIRLVTNPAQRILPGMIEEALEIAVELAFYGERLLGEPAGRILDGPPDGGSFFSNEAVAELSTAINTRLRELEDTLSPPVLTVEFVDPPDAGEAEAPMGVVGLGHDLPARHDLHVDPVRRAGHERRRLGREAARHPAPRRVGAAADGRGPRRQAARGRGDRRRGRGGRGGPGDGRARPAAAARPPRRRLDHLRRRGHAQLLRAAAASRLGAAGRQHAHEPGASSPS